MAAQYADGSLSDDALRAMSDQEILDRQQEVLQIAEPWRPYRSPATAYLFQVALDDPGTPLPEKQQQ